MTSVDDSAARSLPAPVSSPSPSSEPVSGLHTIEVAASAPVEHIGDSVSELGSPSPGPTDSSGRDAAPSPPPSPPHPPQLQMQLQQPPEQQSAIPTTHQAPDATTDLKPPRNPAPRVQTRSPVPVVTGGGYQWGSFIKRAVSTVEQSLDKVLDPSLTSSSGSVDSSPAAATMQTTLEPLASQTAAANANSRISMQQRLALAMQAQRPTSSNSHDSRSSSRDRSERSSFEASRPNAVTDEVKTAAVSAPAPAPAPASAPAPVVVSQPTVIPTTMESTESKAEKDETAPEKSTAVQATADSESTPALRAELRQKQDELDYALGRMSVLEEKVSLLSNQLLAYSSGQRKDVAPLDKQIRERDQKLALLLQEGEELSKKELRYMNTIKRFRGNEQSSARAVQEAQRRQERAEKEAVDLRERLRKSTEIEKKQSDRIKLLAKAESEAEILRRDRDSLKATVSGLRDELANANVMIEDAVKKAQTGALEDEKRKNEALAREIESLKASQVMEKEKITQEVFTLQAKLDRSAERAKTRELELTDEISGLEHKLERQRMQVEELSTGTSGDSHAKMLRQVETLQSQYAIASENWKGIEASLLSRIAGIENERDQLLKRESTLRKSLHDATSRLRLIEAESDGSESKIKDLEAELQLQTDVVQSLRKRLQEESDRSAKAIGELERDKSEVEQKLAEEERLRKEDRNSLAYLRSPPPQPLSPTVLKRGLDAGGSTSPMMLSNNSRVFGLSRESSFGELFSMSGQLPSASSSGPPTPIIPTTIQHRRSSRQVSMTSNGSFVSYPSTPGSATPTFIASGTFSSLPELGEHHHGHDGGSSASSVTGSNNMDDTGSIASTTIGNSSSERMNSVIRRITSELASAKEGIAILTRDRDAAREESVELMREVKDKRALETQAEELKKRVSELEEREQTMLELLGEKTERVNELQDDVADLKSMYRQQIQELIEQVNQK
ncbi:TATA element modulatory factor 1 TATA binding-domain-containing protein [Lipomyces oligophaga]|uniref:TATA element modulatory factor 1 TATA binding-domain-containing protein n=1 Tax=Lipomyces oligophaga TaxID=45792 RepID=UPI0034CEE4A6